MIVIDQERRMVMARGTRYSQEFKEDAVRYTAESKDNINKAYNLISTSSFIRGS